MSRSPTNGNHADPSTLPGARKAPPPRPTGPVAVAQKEAIGQRLQGNLGPGSLWPGVGRLVQRSGRAHYCGSISGQVVGYVQHPNSKDPKRTSTRFLGRFLLATHDQRVLMGAECYFPGTIERSVKAALDMRGQGQGEPIEVSFDVEAAPDEEGRPPSPLGYSYATYDRRPQTASDPLLALAYAAGVLERPAQGELPAPALTEDEHVDPETGEITRQAASAA